MEIKQILAAHPGHVSLGRRRVGAGLDPYFVAEIGNNHNGDFFLAKRLIEEAARAGADAVKFQRRSVPDTFCHELRDKPQTDNEMAGRTYGDYRQGLELALDEFVELKAVAAANGLSFFATPFDLPSVDFLEKVDIPFYKVASFDVMNLPLLEKVASLGKPIILSTGMASAAEVTEAVATILKHHSKVVLLHCISVYPTPDEHINLGVMSWLRREFSPLPVGYSGHEVDILATLAAVARGAAVVERHLTLSRAMPGPDHGTVSIEPDMFREMVDSARRIRVMDGDDGTRMLLDQEHARRDKHGKSVVSARVIPRGAIITEDMLTVKSPGYGIKPREMATLVGGVAAVDIEADTVLRPQDIRSPDEQ